MGTVSYTASWWFVQDSRTGEDYTAIDCLASVMGFIKAFLVIWLSYLARNPSTHKLQPTPNRGVITHSGKDHFPEKASITVWHIQEAMNSNGVCWLP